MSGRHLMVAMLGMSLGVFAGCMCPATVFSGYEQVSTGVLVPDTTEWGLYYNGFDWLADDYTLEIDEAREEVVETYGSAGGVHVIRYRVRDVLGTTFSEPHPYQEPED